MSEKSGLKSGLFEASVQMSGGALREGISKKAGGNLPDSRIVPQKRPRDDEGVPSWSDFLSDDPTDAFLQVEGSIDLRYRQMVDDLYKASKNDADSKRATHWARLFALMQKAADDGWNARSIGRAMSEAQKKKEMRIEEEARRMEGELGEKVGENVGDSVGEGPSGFSNVEKENTNVVD